MKPIKTLSMGLLLTAASTFAQYSPPSEIKGLLDKFRDYSTLTKASSNPETYAVNITTWQMSHGGFSKAMDSKYKSPWDGSASLSSWYSGSTPLGMFDNNATVMEIQFLSNQYKVSTNATNKAKFKASVNKAVDFILTSQHASGSWPQVYPLRTGTTYSNMATYNDNSMVRVMTLVQDMVNKKAPFDSDIVDATKLPKLQTALTKSVDFALKAQIVNNGTPTVWCQQHDPVTFKPVGARAYELPSKSGSESAGILAFLMNWPSQTAAVQKSVQAGLAWYKATRVANLKYSSGNFVASTGASLWYRFYNVENNTHFFSNRDGLKVYNIEQVEAERRTGYQWAGDYGSKLLTAAAKYAPPATTSSSSVAVSSSSVKPSSSSVVASSSSVKLSSSSIAVSSSSVKPSSSSIAISSSSAATGLKACIAFVNGVGNYNTNCYKSGLASMSANTCYTMNPDRGTSPAWINSNANDSWWWKTTSCSGIKAKSLEMAGLVAEPSYYEVFNLQGQLQQKSLQVPQSLPQGRWMLVSRSATGQALEMRTIVSH